MRMRIASDGELGGKSCGEVVGPEVLIVFYISKFLHISQKLS